MSQNKPPDDDFEIRGGRMIRGGGSDERPPDVRPPQGEISDPSIVDSRRFRRRRARVDVAGDDEDIMSRREFLWQLPVRIGLTLAGLGVVGYGIYRAGHFLKDLLTPKPVHETPTPAEQRKVGEFSFDVDLAKYGADAGLRRWTGFAVYDLTESLGGRAQMIDAQGKVHGTMPHDPARIHVEGSPLSDAELIARFSQSTADTRQHIMRGRNERHLTAAEQKLRVSQTAPYAKVSSDDVAIIGGLTQMHPLFLLSMGFIESRWDSLLTQGPNSNGTYDLGLMEFNTAYGMEHLSSFMMRFGRSYAQAERERDGRSQRRLLSLWVDMGGSLPDEVRTEIGSNSTSFISLPLDHVVLSVARAQNAQEIESLIRVPQYIPVLGEDQQLQTHDKTAFVTIPYPFGTAKTGEGEQTVAQAWAGRIAGMPDSEGRRRNFDPNRHILIQWDNPIQNFAAGAGWVSEVLADAHRDGFTNDLQPNGQIPTDPQDVNDMVLYGVQGYRMGSVHTVHRLMQEAAENRRQGKKHAKDDIMDNHRTRLLFWQLLETFRSESEATLAK
ncbi:Uncharacterised protein [uncultured archaeon]|nr:Uncharacterised protein [uncultured archaeon]